MLVLVVGGRLDNPEKNPGARQELNNKLNPHMAPSWNQTRATMVRGKHSRHCTIRAPPVLSLKCVDTHNVYSLLVELIGNWSGFTL